MQACLESWRRFNPTWRVVALNRTSLSEWVDLEQAIDPERRDLDMRKVANVARLCLLRQHGGVWPTRPRSAYGGEGPPGNAIVRAV